jgi:N6-adenosine-specific RNA methylase IME4
LPVEAHATPDAVLFFWVTAAVPLFLFGRRDAGSGAADHAWGFTPKTGQVWDKVLPAGGSYVAVRHEHLIICTRGSCTPDHPVPMPPSVVTERRDPMAIHSAKPDTFRKQIERMYDGPRLELFGRERHEGWTVFGNDASLWAREVGDQDGNSEADDRGREGGDGMLGAIG